jgi:hypothetical protein
MSKLDWTPENLQRLSKKLAHFPDAIKGGQPNEPQQEILAHLYYELIKRCVTIHTNIEMLIKQDPLNEEQVEDAIFNINMEIDFLLNNIKSSGRYDTMIEKYTI